MSSGRPKEIAHDRTVQKRGRAHIETYLEGEHYDTDEARRGSKIFLITQATVLLSGRDRVEFFPSRYPTLVLLNRNTESLKFFTGEFLDFSL